GFALSVLVKTKHLMSSRHLWFVGMPPPKAPHLGIAPAADILNARRRRILAFALKNAETGVSFVSMKIAVAMSGVVVSSSAAAILHKQGHELVGFTMQLWNQRRGLSLDENGEPLPSRCCSLDDVYDARRVAEELGFPFYVLNLEREFERDVVQPFV